MIRTLEFYFLLFFVSAVLGWCMEVTCKLFSQHRFINRGFLIGPYCPIYGVGAAAMAASLSRYADSPVLLFVMAMLICGVLEYLTSYVMEKLFHARWWDYSQKKFNIHGRVCANTLIPFGVLGLAVIYIIKPFLFGQFEKIPQPWLHGICLGLMTLMAADAAVSTSVLGKIRHTAELSGGDNTETLTHAVREKLKKGVFVRRTFRAFPYVQIYNHNVLKRIRAKEQAMRGQINMKREAMRRDVEQWEKHIHDEVAQIKQQVKDKKNS